MVAEPGRATPDAHEDWLEESLTVTQLLGRRYGRGALTVRLRQVATATGLLGRVVRTLSDAEAGALAAAFRGAAHQARLKRQWAPVAGVPLRRRAASRGVRVVRR
jgi:hypothetical protein